MLTKVDFHDIALDEALVPIDDQVKIGACNMGIDPLKMQKEPTYQLTLDILKQYSCYNAFLKTANFEVDAELFREVLQITPKVPNQEFVEPPPHDDLVSFVKQLGYTSSLELVSEMYIDHMYHLWMTFLNIINRCLSGKASVLRKLKFVNKGEKHQKYGMSIPDSLMNDEIRSSNHYMTYLALSTNTEVNVPKVVKGKGKGLMGKKKPDADIQKEKKKDATKKKKDAITRKKRSITFVDNILPDHEEAVKLAESISLIKSEHQDEECRLHETHASLVIGREAKRIVDTELSFYDERTETNGSEKAGNVKVDEEIADKEIVDEEMADEEEAEDDRYEDAYQTINDQARTKQAEDTTKIKIRSMSTPPTIEAQATNVSESDSSSMVLQRHSELEKKVEMLSQVDHAEAIKEPNPINLFHSLSTSTDSFTKYERKNMLFDKMQKSGSFQEHEKHLDLYNALIGSIGLDDVIAKGDIDPTNILKKRHHDDKDKDPSADSEKGIPETLDPEWHKEPNVDDALGLNWFNELVNAEKDPLAFDDLVGSTIDFTKFSKNHIKKDKITKVDLEGPAFKLLKGTYRNSIKLDYNLEQCYLALLYQLD
ncbi:hypothetical protein Tco_0457809 [Tanacetum coccineum]